MEYPYAGFVQVEAYTAWQGDVGAVSFHLTSGIPMRPSRYYQTVLGKRNSEDACTCCCCGCGDMFGGIQSTDNLRALSRDRHNWPEMIVDDEEMKTDCFLP
jgi:hypothetical protein